MGGAIAYQTAVRYHARQDVKPLGAVFGLSCYLNNDSKVWNILETKPNTSKIWPPTYIAHGASDDFISPKWGQATHERFVQNGIPASFQLVPHAYHEMVPAEIADLLSFLNKQRINEHVPKEDL